MAESIEMPFGERTAVGPKTNVLGGCLNPLRAKGTFEGGDFFQPIVKYREYPVCNRYSQSYLVFGRWQHQRGLWLSIYCSNLIY